MRLLSVLTCICLASCAALGGNLVLRNTRPVVKIGLVAPFEGRYRALGYEVLYAVKWAIGEQNDRGGIAGTMVELVALNDSDDPKDSAFQAHKLAIDQDVVGAIGPFSEGAVTRAAPVFGELGLPTITPATCPSLAVGSGSVFCLGAGADQLLDRTIEVLPGGARVTLLRGQANSSSSLPAHAGWPELAVPLDGAAIEELRAHPADVYLYEGDVLNAAEALIQMRSAGIDAPLWGGPSLARVQLPQIAGDAVGGTCYAITQPALADHAADSAFSAGYRGLSGAAPGPWAALAYDATRLLLDAVERAIRTTGQATRESVRAALGEIEGTDGRSVFVNGRRQGARVDLYCYDVGEAYPGHAQDGGTLD